MTHNAQYMDWQCPTGNITVLDSFAYRQGVYTKSDYDGKTQTISWPHNFGTPNPGSNTIIPKIVRVIAASPDAALAPFSYTADATNITITFRGVLPPPPTAGNPNNLQYQWVATI
jgi:hypothetical protein